ncbi:MAG: ATP-binding protein [Cyanobacteria bacterium P01_G01_bin.54]
MSVDPRAFYRAVNPTNTEGLVKPEDQKYYTDFSEVRGADLIDELKTKISFFSPDDPTCTLFTGYIGCGKSTELVRLKQELEQERFHVVYFESSEDIEMADVDVSDLLLAIALRISRSLEEVTIKSPQGLLGLMQGAIDLLFSEVELKQIEVGLPSSLSNLLNLPEVKLSAAADGEFSLALGIASITGQVKGNTKLHEQLSQYLGPRIPKLIEMINTELILPAIAQLKAQGKQGIVVIMDNLDRMDQVKKSWGRSQIEYIFVDRGAELTKLACHMVYTMPLALKFSNEYGNLTQRFPDDPQVLPMVPVTRRDGEAHREGMALLRQMVLARALPDATPDERLAQLTEVFESIEVLDRVCTASGGHPRDLLRLLSAWVQKQRKFPLTGAVLEEVIRARQNELRLAIHDREWALLRQVQQTKKVSDDEGYQVLIKSRFVFEYRNPNEWWFEVNPLIAESPELQP